MEQPMQTPRRNKHKTPRKESQQAAQIEQGQANTTPNTTKNPRGHRNNLRDVVNTTSTSSLPGYSNPSTEAFEAGENLQNQAHKKKRNRKKTGDRSQPEQINVKSPLSPPPTMQQAVQGTPVKAIQMYAGPTFHTSPAPSSLPLPKFFAQNMALAKAPQESIEALGTPLDDSSTESSSQSNGESPTLRNALPALGNELTRETSPLDIFFNADRQEKARKANPSSLAYERSKSASPTHESSGVNQQSPFATPATPTSAENQAKTLALKQLLLFPQAQKTPKLADSAQSSPFLDIPYRPLPGRSSSENTTPTASTLNLNSLSSEKGSFYDPPSLSNPLGGGHAGKGRRPLPHHLRQEFLKSLALDQSPDVSSKTNTFAPIPRA